MGVRSWTLGICSGLSTFPLQDPGTHPPSCWSLCPSLKIALDYQELPCPRCALSLGAAYVHCLRDAGYNILVPSVLIRDSSDWPSQCRTPVGLVEVPFTTTWQFNFSKLGPFLLLSFPSGCCSWRQSLINLLYANLCLGICFQGFQTKWPYNLISNLRCTASDYCSLLHIWNTVRGLGSAVVSLASSELREGMPGWGKLCAERVGLQYPPWQLTKIHLRSLYSMLICLQK